MKEPNLETQLEVLIYYLKDEGIDKEIGAVIIELLRTYDKSNSKIAIEFLKNELKKQWINEANS